MFKVKNNFEEFKKQFLNSLDNAGKEIFITELAEIQSNTPVKTGALKRSITGYKKRTDGIIKIRWGSKLPYARKVEFKDKSYIRSTLKRDESNIRDILYNHLKEGMK